MLEPPDVRTEQITATLHEAYGLSAAEVTFLPLGADVDTAVYRIVAEDSTAFFLKLRRGPVHQAAIAIPHWLATAGMRQVIAPLAPRPPAPALWSRLDSYTVVLYPYVTGRSGWDVELSEQQWIEFGAALRALHSAGVPPEHTRTVPHEGYAAVWRDRVTAFLRQAAERSFADPAADGLARLLRARSGLVSHMIQRADQLARRLAHEPRELCLCHGDIHAGNVLLDGQGRLYLVDWDTLVLAPRERDLMFVGGGVGGIWNDAQEAAWFYQGYGPIEIDLPALTYFRYERIVQDIAATCEQLLETTDGGAGRAVALRQLASQFEPNNVVEIARATDRRLEEP